MNEHSILSSVLLVDDDEADNFIHRLNLEWLGLTETVNDFLYAHDALQHLQSYNTNLIFLDVHLPRMNGFEFLTAYRSLALSQRAAVVLLTSSLAPSDLELSTQFSEILAYCPKPLTRERAEMILKAVIRTQQTNPEVAKTGLWRDVNTELTVFQDDFYRGRD